MCDVTLTTLLNTFYKVVWRGGSLKSSEWARYCLFIYLKYLHMCLSPSILGIKVDNKNINKKDIKCIKIYILKCKILHSSASRKVHLCSDCPPSLLFIVAHTNFGSAFQISYSQSHFPFKNTHTQLSEFLCMCSYATTIQVQATR